jgi:vancomycin resistance protein YoaR
VEGLTGAVTEPTDSLGHAADPYREPYDPTRPPPGDTGVTDLLDFPPMPPYPGSPYSAPDAQVPVPEPTPDPAPQPPVASTGLRVAEATEATARLRIKLPDSLPQPSTTLRPHAVWEDADDSALPEGAPRPYRSGPEATPFAQVAASPARPSALPAELAALTTATLVVPLPPDTRPTPALLTTTLPPDSAAQANAALLEDAFHDTFEQVFGIDLASASPADVGLEPESELAAAAGVGARPAEGGDLLGAWFREEGGAAHHEPDAAFVFTGPAFDSMDQAPYEQTPYEYVPGTVAAAAFGGPYGVPTYPAPFPGVAAHDTGPHDPLRHALALRYLGGIFHDSSGEASYLDPGALRGRSPELQAAAGGTGDPQLGDTALLPAGIETMPHLTAEPDAPTEQLVRIPGPTKPSDDRAPRRRTDKTRPAPGGPHAAHATERGSGGKLITGLVLLASVFAIVYGLALAIAGGVFGGTVPRGTVVDGVSIGGLTPSAAEQALDSALGPRSRAPIRLVVGQTPMTLDPAQSGLSFDAAQTVAAAQVERTNPFQVIPALFGVRHSVVPVVTVDNGALTRALSTIAASYNSPMVEGQITFQAAKPVVTPPKEGRAFSVAGAVAAVRSAYLRLDGPVLLPVQALHPKATPAALQDALAYLARPAVAGPIALTTGSVTENLTADQIGDAVVIVPDDNGHMVAQVDGAKLRGDLNAAALAQETPAVNASFTVDTNGTPTLVPGRDGRGFPPDALAGAVQAVLVQPVPRTATVPLGDLPPTFTTADAQALGVTDVLGTTTVPVPSAPNRFANVQRATALVAGSIIGPGETWSFLKTIGPLDTAHGFAVPGAAQKAGVDPSGGVDTVATAVFGAAFASGMGDTVHHPHASFVDRYPVGLDAAVVAPGTDMQWTNTGDHPVYLYASYANDAVTVALLGEKTYDQVTVQVSQRYAVVPAAGCAGSGAVPGFQVDVSRTLMRGGAQVGGEQFHVQYVPQNGAGCPGGATGGAVSNAPSSPSGSGGGGGSGGSGGGAPSPAASPSPSPSGLLGGLLH